MKINFFLAPQTARKTYPTPCARSSSASNPCFGKCLRNKASVFNTNQNRAEKVNFMEYNTREKQDRSAIKAICDEWGEQAQHIYLIALPFMYYDNPNMRAHNKNRRTWTIETAESKILAAAQTESGGTRQHPTLKINRIETDPAQQYGNDDRTYRGAGLQLVKKLIEEARKEEFAEIFLQSGNDKFWENIPFFKKEKDPIYKGQHIFRLDKSDYDGCLEALDSKIKAAQAN